MMGVMMMLMMVVMIRVVKVGMVVGVVKARGDGTSGRMSLTFVAGGGGKGERGRGVGVAIDAVADEAFRVIRGANVDGVVDDDGVDVVVDSAASDCVRRNCPFDL